MSVIKNVLIWDAKRQAALDGDIEIAPDGRISAVRQANTSTETDVLYDGRGHTAAIPGLANTHTHVSMTLLRGLGEELPLMEWLQTKIFPVEDRLEAKHIRAGAELAFAEMIAGGVTAYADMYYFMDEVAEATISCGLRAALSRGLPGSDKVKVRENLDLARKYNGYESRITVQLGPHAPYTVPREALADIAALAKENDIGVHFHWLETAGELETFRNEFKISPSDYLEEAGLLDVKNLILAHSVYHPVEEIDRISRPNITVAHNPKSNLKLGSGYAPVREMLAQGVSVALGTDGAASNNRLDIWDEMRAAALMHKGYHRDPTLLSAREVLAMGTQNGPRGMGFDSVGLLQPGYFADIALVDIDRPEYVGCDRENLPEFLVYAGSSRNVAATIVAGKVLYKDGAFATLDVDHIKKTAEEYRRQITA